MSRNSLAQIQAVLEGILARLAGIEGRLADFAQHTGTSSAPHSGLLVGWEQIAKHSGKRPRTLQGYKRRCGFPAIRFGRNTVSSPELIAGWLLSYDKHRRDKKRRCTWTGSMYLGG